LHLLKLILLDGLQLGVLHLVWMAAEDELPVRFSNIGYLRIF
jgi:hypothetical protein